MILQDTAVSRQFDRLPPYDVESEMSVIGAMILAGHDPATFARIRAAVNEEDFFQADHALLYRVLCEIFDRRRTVDGMLLRAELNRQQLTEEVGGIDYLAQLIHAVPAAVNGPHYAADVREKAVLRRLISGAADVLRRCYGAMKGDHAHDIARDFLHQLHNVAEGRCADAVVRLDTVIDNVLAAHAAGAPSRIRTGLAALDSICGGLPIDRLTISAGRPGMGKSQVGKQIIRNIASGIPAAITPFGDVARPAQDPIVCGIVSIEETLDKIGKNYLAAASSVENNRIAYGTCTAHEWREVEDAAPSLKSLPVYLTDRPIRLTDVEAVITTMATRHKCKVIFVDYLQLVHGDSAPTKEQEIAKVSMTLKNLFKTLGVTGIVAAQLSRANETGGIRRPEMRDLRHSGQIEQDGDLIVLLHRDDYYRYKEKNFMPTHVLEAIVAKNKDGAVGTARLHFEGKFQTVTDIAPGQDVMSDEDELVDSI